MNDIPRWIDFSELPTPAGGFSRLFLDYLQNSPDTRPFFPHHFRDAAAYDGVMERIASRHPDRATLVEVLREETTAFGSEPLTVESIALLEKPDTYAVVTGQQV